MRKSATLFAGVASLVLAANGCSTGAAVESFSATLTRGAEVPAPSSTADGSTTATGSASFTRDGDKVTYTLTVNGLIGITAAHVHAPAAATATSTATGFVVTLFDGPATSGTAAFSGRLDCVAPSQAPATGTASTITAPVTSTCGSVFGAARITASGSTRTLDQLTTDMAAGNAYVNVHTSANKDGAIRGQIR